MSLLQLAFPLQRILLGACKQVCSLSRLDLLLAFFEFLVQLGQELLLVVVVAQGWLMHVFD